jgi:hypothetical protein
MPPRMNRNRVKVSNLMRKHGTFRWDNNEPEYHPKPRPDLIQSHMATRKARKGRDYRRQAHRAANHRQDV